MCVLMAVHSCDRLATCPGPRTLPLTCSQLGLAPALHDPDVEYTQYILGMHNILRDLWRIRLGFCSYIVLISYIINHVNETS